jgi:plastocyanin
MKRFLGAVVLGVVLFGVESTARADIFTVLVKSFPNEFQPSDITIDQGDGIVWAWLPGVAHTVTSDTGLFDSGLKNSPFRYRRVFQQPGDYFYHCAVHGMAGGIGQSGVIRVIPPDR